jgi:hypothetical protein
VIACSFLGCGLGGTSLVNANVSLKLKDFSKIAPIVQQLADADITESQSLNYTLEDIDAAKAKAVDDAYRRARESAVALARSAGRGLGELSYASVDTFENVRPMVMAGAMMKMNMAGAPAPTEECHGRRGPEGLPESSASPGRARARARRRAPYSTMHAETKHGQ